VGELNNFGARLEREVNKAVRDVDIDTDTVGRKISEGVITGINTSKKEFTTLSDTARETFADVETESDKLGNKIGESVRKGTDSGRDALGRFVGQGKKSAREFSLSFGELPGWMGKIGKTAGLALAAGVAAGSLAQATQTVLAFTAAVAPAVGAVGPLAAGFIGAKIAAGTFKLAVLGVGEALAAGIEGDATKLNEALEKMPKTAQAAVKETLELKDSILAVREVVQGNFAGQLIGSIKPLGETYLPMVTNQLGLVAQGFGKAGKETSVFLQTPGAIRAVDAALGDTTTAINNVSAGVPGMVRAFLPLWEVASSFLPGLTDGFTGLTQRVSEFLEGARESGQLATFFQNGLTVLGQLGQLLVSIGSIIRSVFQAATAGGGDLLGVLGAAVQQAAAFLNTAQGMQALTAVFTVLGQVAGLFGQALGIVLPVVGQLVSALAGALAPVLPVISGLLTQMAPVFQQIGAVLAAVLVPVIGVVANLLATLVPVILPIVSAIMGALLPALQGIAPILAAVGTVIATVLSQALIALLPLFQSLAPVMQQIAAEVLPSLLPLVASLGELLLALMPIIQPLIGLLVAMIQSGLQQFVTVMPPILAAINWLVQALTSLVGPIASAIGWVIKIITNLVNVPPAVTSVMTIFNNLRNIASTVFGFIGRFVQTQIANVKSVLASISGVINTVIAAFNRGRANISAALSAARAAVSSAVSSIIGFLGRLASGAASAIGRMIAVVRGIGGRIKGAVGNLGSLLVSAGRNVIQGLIDGISQKLGALRAKASSAASTIRNLFPFSPAKEGPLSGSGSPEIAGGKIASMIADGLERRIPAIRAAATRAADTARFGGGLDFSGGRILSAALGANRAAPALPPGTARTGTTFASGAVTLNFYGPPPTEDEAFKAGRAAGRGLAAAQQTQGVRTTMRTI
jgi:phage-related protein